MNHEFITEVIVEGIATVTAFLSGFALAILLERRKRKITFRSVKAALEMELRYICELIKEKKPVFSIQAKTIIRTLMSLFF
jgi:hypothetical protein